MQMSSVIDAYKSGRYNESESAKIMMGEQMQHQNDEIEEIKAELTSLRKENAALKLTTSKSMDYQSAMQSNNAAINEKIETSNRLVKQKETELVQMRDRVGQLDMENAQLREEISMYKGRCTNLARDVEMHYNEMHKLNNDSSSAGQQVRILQDRTQSLEQDVETMRQQRNEVQEEARRVSHQAEILEKELIGFRTKQLKAEGDSHSSSATVQRLQSQLNGKMNDCNLLIVAKNEMERLLRESQEEVIKLEKSRDDVYKQLVSTKENLDIMINEQKILSDELTLKQNELMKSEREKLTYERQLMELNHVKSTLKNATEGNIRTIEESTRGEFERNKLVQKVRELETQLQISKKDTEELSASYRSLVQDKNALMEQLTQFEKDSFEIQARVKRGLEAERDV